MNRNRNARQLLIAVVISLPFSPAHYEPQWIRSLFNGENEG